MDMSQLKLTHYVPILRWKQAERLALANLYGHDSICITPLVELVLNNFIHRSKNIKGLITRLNIEEGVNKIGEQLIRYCGGRPFFIDLWRLPPDVFTQGLSQFLAMLGQYAINSKLSLVPVTRITNNNDYQSVIRTLVASMNNQGVCLRLTCDDIKKSTLTKDISALLSFIQVLPEAVDLIVDFQTIDQYVPTFKTLCKCLPSINKWRNFIVASGAFPEDLSELRKNDIYRIPRSDWISWRDQVTAITHAKRLPVYSDYTIQYPLYKDRKGPLNISASIRYTADECWVIMRGESIFAEDGPGTAQWPANALLLREQTEYCGDTFSYGDSYIKNKSTGYENPGNPTTWLQASVNHHMTFVVRRLATLFEPSIVGVS
jgi:hypothetical protein